MKRILAGLVLAAAVSCSAPEPKPYTVEGTWDGAVNGNAVHLVITQDDDLVGGSGTYQIGATGSQTFSLNRVDNTPSGSLTDGALYVSVRNTAGSACTGTLTGTFRSQESDANAFTATLSCGTFTFTGTVTRQ